MAVAVGSDHPLLTELGIHRDCVNPVTLGSKAGRLDRQSHIAFRGRIIPDKLEARQLRHRLGGQPYGLPIRRPIAFGLLGYGAVIELVPEMPVLLQLERGADFHLMRLVEAGDRRSCSRGGDQKGHELHGQIP